MVLYNSFKYFKTDKVIIEIGQKHLCQTSYMCTAQYKIRFPGIAETGRKKCHRVFFLLQNKKETRPVRRYEIVLRIRINILFACGKCPVLPLVIGTQAINYLCSEP